MVPEGPFVAVVLLLVAHVTLVVSVGVSFAEGTQRRRVCRRSRDAAGIEEVRHTCSTNAPQASVRTSKPTSCFSDPVLLCFVTFFTYKLPVKSLDTPVSSRFFLSERTFRDDISIAYKAHSHG